MRLPGRRSALELLFVLLAACARDAGGGGPADAQAWSRRLRGDAPTRDLALVELRRRKAEGIPCLLALLDDAELARTAEHAEIREELVYLLGEAGTTSIDAQQRLVRVLGDPQADVGEALAAARGLAVSWRMCRDLPVLEAYVALLRRITRPEDARKAASVNALAFAACPPPHEPGFVNALRAGARDVKSCAFCVGELRRLASREGEFVDLFRELGERLDAAPSGDDAVAEAEKLAAREALGIAVAEARAR